jgi:hypothetical protein
MSKILFIDDEKKAEWFDLPEDTLHAKTVSEAIAILRDGGEFVLYVDYDLGEERTGADLLLLALIMADLKINKVFCISLNAAGVGYIAGVCRGFNIPFEDIGRKVMFEKFDFIDGQSG